MKKNIFYFMLKIIYLSISFQLQRFYAHPKAALIFSLLANWYSGTAIIFGSFCGTLEGN